MSRPPAPNRPAVVLVICIAVVAAATSVAVAVDEPRDAPADTSPPVRVYVSETLDISTVELTGGGTVGTESTTFLSVGDGGAFSVDPADADFDGVEPGSYYAERDSDEQADIAVVEPRITDFDVRNERGVDVAGDTLDANDFEEVTITVEYNFEEADRLDVTVENPDGVDLAGNARITESGGSVTVDTSNADPGSYRISVEGSDIEDGRASTTVTVAGSTAEPTSTPTATPTPTPTPEPTSTTTATPTPTATSTVTPTATPTATPTTSPTPHPPETPEPTTTPTPTVTEGGGPGFGPVVALLALLALTAVARRRR